MPAPRKEMRAHHPPTDPTLAGCPVACYLMGNSVTRRKWSRLALWMRKNLHVPDGVVSNGVMLATNALALAGVAVGLSKIDYERAPRVGVLASVFFVASFIHIDVGPFSVHLLLNGLLGFLLGWGAFPALAAALLLQAVVLGFGGVTALGANVLNVAAPAVLCYYLFAGRCRRSKTTGVAFFWGALAGAGGVAFTCLLLALLLHLSNAESYDTAIKALLISHAPIMAIEAVVVGATAAFLYRVRPELLAAPMGGAEREEHARADA